MDDWGTSGTSQGPAHSRRRRPGTSEERLRALGELALPPSAEETESLAKERASRFERRFAARAVVVLAVVVIVLAIVQWFRPLPSPMFRSTVSKSIRLPGALPSLPWPTTGSAALAVEGVGNLGRVGSTQPVPIASIAKVLTAYVILKDHPLLAGATGPTIAVNAETLAAYQAGVATEQSVVPVAAGETLNELQVLEGLLVASGNDMATMLADWDAGSTTAFVAKMNATAHQLGLDATHITDPSGLDPGTVSTPSDLVRLGEAAMAIPAFAQIVDMAQVTLPLAGLVYNFDYLLGHDGFLGIKTGSDTAAGGCFLFAVQRAVGGQSVTLVGAVLGQQGTSALEASLEVADLLVNAAFSSIAQLPLVAPGHSLGQLVDAWGSSAPVTASESQTILGWPGLIVPIHVRLATLHFPVASGARIGVLDIEQGGQATPVVLRSTRPLAGPSAFWRLTRL